jgi:hypothetical protein
LILKKERKGGKMEGRKGGREEGRGGLPPQQCNGNPGPPTAKDLRKENV